MKKISILISLILFLLMGISVYSQEPAPTPREDSQNWQYCTTKTDKNGNTHQYCTQKNPLLIKIDESEVTNPSANLQRQNIDQSKNRNFSTNIKFAVEIFCLIFTTIATIFIAIFNRRLWKITRELWNTSEGQRTAMENQVVELRKSVEATERAANAAKESAESLPITERAYLFVKVKEGEYRPKGVLEYGNDRTIFINIEIINYGRTPAIISESNMWGQYEVKIPEGSWEKMPLKTIPPNIVITSGKPFIHTGEITMPNFELEAIVNGNLPLECKGEIKYKDIFKKEHRTWFTWYWDCNINGFRISNFEYNNGYD